MHLIERFSHFVLPPLKPSQNCNRVPIILNLFKDTDRPEDAVMTLTHEQEQVVELLRAMASSIDASALKDQPAELILPGVSDPLPWRQHNQQGRRVTDFGVGMPPLTQRYS